VVRIIFAAEQGPRARAAANTVRAALAQRWPEQALSIDEGPVVLGPASLFRLRGRERQVLVVKASERRAAVQAIGAAVQAAAASREHAGVSFSVDVDPQ
jgi:primosomal protein N'